MPPECFSYKHTYTLFVLLSIISRFLHATRANLHSSRSTTTCRCILHIFPSRSLDNHLRNTLSTKRFTSHKALTLHTSQSVESRRNSQHNSGGNQTRCTDDQTQPLHQCHHTVKSCSHVIRCESSHECVEFRGRGTDSQQERNFDEYDEEGGCAGFDMS